MSSICHPSWIRMIKECIAIHLPQRGVSRAQIKKYVRETYKVEFEEAQIIELSKAITLGEQKGIFVIPKGHHGKVELARSTCALRKKAKVPPFKFKFRKQKGAKDLSTSTGFILLLRDIRHHLLRSQSTRAIYVAMAKKFFLRSKKDVQDVCKEPTDDDFLSYVDSNWPIFRSCLTFGETSEHSLIWGSVVKGEARKTNEINIFSELVLLIELSAKRSIDSGLSVALYKLVMTAVVLHELAHAFTKFHFHDNIMPVGVGIGGKNSGESGWLVEEQIVGGHLLVEWADKQHFGDLFQVNHVLLTKGTRRWELDEDIAMVSLNSLKGSKFVPPAQASMKVHTSTPGSRRGRVAERTEMEKVVRVKPLVGLGIRTPGPYISYIGDDKRQ